MHRFSNRRWIQKAHIKKGALHRQLKIPVGKKIPIAVLRKAAKAKGKLGKRARLALNFRRFRRRKKRFHR